LNARYVISGNSLEGKPIYGGEVLCFSRKVRFIIHQLQPNL